MGIHTEDEVIDITPIVTEPVTRKIPTDDASDLVAEPAKRGGRVPGGRQGLAAIHLLDGGGDADHMRDDKIRRKRKGGIVEYKEFIVKKSQLVGDGGFDPLWIPDTLFDFQKHILEWAVRKGRAAVFADCGLGKTFIQLAWAENVARKTGGRVLILTPLAVGQQTVKEGAKLSV